MAWKNDYDDLMKDIASSGQNWSQFDLDLAKRDPDAGRSIYTQKDLFGKAGTDAERQAAHDAAEAIRQRYGGYSGGKDGGSFTLSDKYAPPVETFDPSKYGPQIDELLSEIMGRDPFQYSPGADPSYQAYSEKYRNLGRQAREDALGSAAAMTGGQLSSFAMTAGQQAQNAYNAQLSDKIPELERMAYDMYLGDLGQKRADLATLQGLDETEYGRFRDQQGDRLENWQLNYQVGRDDLADQRYDQEWQHRLDREDVDDQRYEDERDYQREQDSLKWAYQEDSDAFDRALAKWQLTGTLDAESAKVLGIPAGTKTTDYAYQLAQQAKSSGGGRKGSSTGKESGMVDYSELFSQGIETEGDAYLYLLAKGHNSTVAGKLAGYFAEWMKTHEPIRDVSQLGDAAMSIASQMSRANSGQHPAFFADSIEKALKSGSITEAEADFLLGAMGY